ncbi:redoxin domain-containing protein [Gracilibacillus sp. S3-1-1]|uniref:Redoxin domain-containing protein n=1 Tax=Gracilibacillus pellucidus TaxID=3095368 RepID=A0ACC6M7U4_9BACI|nr:redoxin domain-containing protein [Gracilibacillus sp. S3-1-1]MDX8047049.1 redoxin domain-containing protein [Gracilibacillus sp. S3-1-1]
MWKSIISVTIVLILVGIVFVTNFTDMFDKQADPNIVDVTGDTSIDGVTITAPNAEQIQVGNNAPSFQLPDLNGNEVEAFDVEQEYILLNFWATWCKPCTEEMPDLQAFEEANQATIKVVAVNTTNSETSVDKVKSFVDDGDFDFTILLDEDNTVYDHYAIVGMPTSFIIRNSDRQVMARVNGAMSLEQMQTQLEQIEKEN